MRVVLVKSRRWLRFGLLLLLIAGARPAFPQKLSLRHFDISDGLVNGNVRGIYQDAKGYIWFGTSDGLSRFDGYRFVSYGRRAGLSNTVINSIVEDRDGRVWIATNGAGVALLNEARHQTSGSETQHNSTQTLFSTFTVGPTPQSNRVNQLFVDSRGRLWCLTDAGLFLATLQSNAVMFSEVVSRGVESRGADEDTGGRLWFGLGDKLVEIEDRKVVRSEIIKDGMNHGYASNEIVNISHDSNGRLLITTQKGLYEFSPRAKSSSAERWRKIPLHLGLAQYIQAAVREPDGTTWLGTANGLVQYQSGVQKTFGPGDGLTVDFIHDLFRDRDANLWIATEGGGAYRLGGESIVSYTQEMGLPHPLASGVLEGPTGRILADYTYAPGAELVDLDGKRIHRHQEVVALPVSASSVSLTHYPAKSESARRWGVWLPTTASFAMRQPILQLRNGMRLNFSDFVPLHSRESVCVYEDDSGGLWFDSDDKTVRRMDSAHPSLSKLRSFPADFALTDPGGHPLMITDHAGGLWLGGIERLGRIWHGQFMRVGPTEGLPKTDPLSFYMDSRGWLWIGTRGGGVSMTTEPGAEHPRFEHFSTEQSLSSDSVGSITEDRFGRMYFGSSNGLDRFDPKAHEWRHFTTKDGLAGNRIFRLLTDHNGSIWVATSDGVSKLSPAYPEPTHPSPPIYLSRVSIAGEDLEVPERGAKSIATRPLPASRDNLTIEFVALQFNAEGHLRYQYRLEGADTEWSRPTLNRSVTYPRLTAGKYKFLVRAVDQAGIEGADTAVVSFQILQPVWRTWWFLSIIFASLALLIYRLYRYRVARLIELQQIRIRIATDLHDDIGSNLSLIAMASDMASRKVSETDAQAASSFALIANTSRATVDSMSDIVWAVNPSKDYVGDLTQRMRRVAEEILATKNIALSFTAPESEYDHAIRAEKRREIYMIFKESVNNIARHSRCRNADVTLTLVSGCLEMVVKDDGLGFDVLEALDGNGLSGMQRRAKSVGGKLEIHSQPQEGTKLLLRVPLDSRSISRRWVNA